MPGYNLGMLNWSFPADSAWSAVLAADARVPLSEDPGPYQGDLIWELSLAGKEPAALTVHSTLGLRAVSAAFFLYSTVWASTASIHPTSPALPG